MPVPEGVITSTENFDQTKVVVEEVHDDLSAVPDSSEPERTDGDEESK